MEHLNAICKQNLKVTANGTRVKSFFFKGSLTICPLFELHLGVHL
jgi:hypothetical protein